MALAPPADAAATSLEVVPQLIERLGLHTIVHAALGEHQLTCLFNGDPSIATGAPLTVHMPTSQFHLFDAQGTAVPRST